MSERSTFYVTTPIYYVNDVPHIGHATTTVLADALARHHRRRGDDTHFLTGTDEHGQKVQQAAERLGVPPREHCDSMVVRFQELWRALGIANDDFIRTTEERHVRVVQAILADLHARGELYQARYEGWYCVPEERYWTEKELAGGRCPDCGREVVRLAEENWYFRMGRHQEWLVRHIEENPGCIQPETRRNEVLGFLRQPLGDLCISRPKSRLSWGIEIPFAPDFVTYVWFDALINYISAPGYGTPGAPIERLWPACHHLIGKDILTTHCVYWTTMLHAIGLPFPRMIFAHGWWTAEGQKMSKSLGNVVDPGELVGRYGRDTVRYFLLREGPFGPDSDFSRRALIARVNGDLANDLGNLHSRVLAMNAKYFGGEVPAEGPPTAGALPEAVAAAVAEVPPAMDRIAPQAALAAIWGIVRRANKFLDEEKPWALAKDPAARPRLARCLRDCLEALRATAGLLWPFLPDTAERMGADLGLGGVPAPPAAGEWDLIPPATALRPSGPLFPRIEE